LKNSPSEYEQALTNVHNREMAREAAGRLEAGATKGGWPEKEAQGRSACAPAFQNGTLLLFLVFPYDSSIDYS
jgi:hypothetical protein